MKYVSVDHAASIVGVSSATIRNWVKAGYISPVSVRPLSFSEMSIFDLKEQIATEAFGRLKSRANKSASSNTFVPEEYANNSTLLSHIAAIFEYLKKESLDVELVMFCATLHLLADKDEVTLVGNGNELFDLNNHAAWRRKSVKEVMAAWMASLEARKLTSKYNAIFDLFFPHEEEDYLGLLYQSISSEGCKSEQGSYFTPTKLVIDSLAHITGPIKTFLDPCCGTGKFLVHAARSFSLSPENVLGFDIDRIATNIAKINLLLAYRELDFVPKIYCMDSLSELATGGMYCDTNNLLASIDAIATNPPWGAYKNSVSKSQLFGAVKSGETFSLFIEKSVRLLRDGGQLSMILPESILKIKTHSDIRSLLLNETTISTISLLGRQFTGVYTPVIRLDLVKERPSDKSIVTVENIGTKHHVLQNRFNGNDNATFDVQITQKEEDLLERIYSVDYTTLDGNAEWALGVVTGDNKKHISDISAPGFEPIFRGSDLCPYFIGDTSSYIRYSPEQYQQVAKDKYYRAQEKLLYKFISKRLVFSYDNKQRLSLNSANILIPAIPGMSIKVVLAFLNSKVFQYVFAKKFSTHKILRGDLEKLPFPRLGKHRHDAIERLVDVAITNRQAPEALDELVFDAFSLDKKDVELILNMFRE